MAEGYSKVRLEGRALEHALTRIGGHGIRMKCWSTGSFYVVRCPVARSIRVQMKSRVEVLLRDLAEQGLHWRGGEAPVKIGDATRSVDLRLWVERRQEEALLETVWTRGSLEAASDRATSSLSWLKKAANSGRLMLTAFLFYCSASCCCCC